MASVKEKKDGEKKSSYKKVYCGPNLPGLNQFTIIDGVPKIIMIHIESCPAIEKLIVPIDRLSNTRLRLSVKGSYEQKKYLEIIDYLGGR